MKTKHSKRNIKYLDPIIKEIDLYYHQQEQFFKINNIVKDPRYENLLFLNNNGTMIKENTAHRHWNEFLEKNNIKSDITFHSFRRFFSEWLEEQGVSKKVIKEFMGHATESQTEYYQFTSLDFAEKEMNKVKLNIEI